jgi:formate C-acetyltransferase
MLNLALHNGFDTRLQKQAGPQTGDAASFQTFDDLYRAYREQMVYCVEKGAALNNQDVRARKDFLSCVRTFLIPECIEKGIGVLQGGATYNGIQGEVVGLTNTANGLIAVKKLIYDEQKFSMKQLIQALDANFEGYEDIRSMLLHAPKFGNNHLEVDNLRYEITRDLYMELSSHKAELGGVHWGGEVIFSYHISQGYCVGALPDGRLAYTPLADSAGPSQGTDTSGLTAVLLSASKLPFNMLCTSINLNLKFSLNLWFEQKDKILTAFQSYFQIGGGQLQINVLDACALRDALDHPMEHKSLVVRVGGFSAYFVELPRDLQLEIISRTETAG